MLQTIPIRRTFIAAVIIVDPGVCRIGKNVSRLKVKVSFLWLKKMFSSNTISRRPQAPRQDITIREVNMNPTNKKSATKHSQREECVTGFPHCFFTSSNINSLNIETMCLNCFVEQFGEFCSKNCLAHFTTGENRVR